jgi:transcriptional regulator with XRE-family HTH domain
MNEVQTHLKRRRLSCNLTQRELAQRSGVAYSTLRRLESTGQGSLKDYFLLQAVFDQLSPLGTPEVTSSHLPLQTSNQPIRQRIRKPQLGPSSTQPSSLEPEPYPLPLSKKISLDFPYDWSNPNISEDALIAKVLDKARFMDVSRVFAYFGAERVKAVAEDFSIDLQHGVLGALMPSIKRGEQYA